MSAGLKNLAVAVAVQGPRHLWRSITGVLDRIASWLIDTKHAQYGLSVTRILFGVMMLTMTLANFPTRYYTFGNAARWTGELAKPSSDFATLFPFSIPYHLAHSNVGLTFLFIILCGISLGMILGWHTKIMVLLALFFWGGFTEIQDMVGDQSDNIVRISFLMLVFADPGIRWSLDARRRSRFANQDHYSLDVALLEPVPQVTGRGFMDLFRGIPVLPLWFTNILHNLVLVILTAQVCFVYVSGALYKSAGLPWKQGYAIYDTLQVLQFSTWPELVPLLTTWAPLVAMLSIGTIVVQAAFPGALLHRWTRIPIMWAILGFHIGIAIFMGLPWFSLAMVAIDSIFIRDVTWLRLSSWTITAFQGKFSARITEPTDSEEETTSASASISI